MGMMKVTVHQITGMIAVRNGFVAAAGAVNVVGRVAAADVAGGTTVRIRGRDFDGVVLNGPAVLLMMKMAVMQVVDVIAVLDGGVTAVLSVIVIVMVAVVIVSHGGSSPGEDFLEVDL